MSWKDLFKSKSDAPPQEADGRVRWFGKLPTYADYYSSSTDEDWAVEFNDWVLTGYELYLGRRREAGGNAHIPSGYAVVRLPKSGMTVLAASADFGGDMRGRPFPLCFYVGVPSKAWPGPTSDRILGAIRVLDQLGRLRERVARFVNSPGRFEDAFGGLELSLHGVDDGERDDSWVKIANQTGFEPWFAAARQCLKIQDATDWLPRVAKWGASIASLESDDFEPTLRFPLARPTEFGVQVAGWTHWLAQRMNLDKRSLSLLISLDQPAGTGQLSIVARELVKEDYLLLTPLAATLPYLDDTCTLGPESATADEPVAVPTNWATFVEYSAAT